MKKKDKKFNLKEFFFKKRSVLIFFLVLIFSVLYTYYFRIITDDELFNYGFSKSILDGLIPYKDFNMIIPPFFHYLLSLILKIFGKKLIIYHILIGVMLSIITLRCFKKVGISSICILICILTYPYTGYNIFCLFLFFILLTRKEKKNTDLIDALIIVMMILSKQTLILLTIPSLIYSKNIKKTFLFYSAFALGFIAYLLILNNFYQFFDYCLFGMFDFANKNSTGFNFLIVVEALIIIVLSYLYFKKRDKQILYVLMFQIMAFPICNFYHFIISFAPIIYLVLFNLKSYKYITYLTLVTFTSFFLVFNLLVLKTNYKYLTFYNNDTFMKNRVVFNSTSNFINDVSYYLDYYSPSNVYYFGYFSYLIKLNLDIPINKFDLINNGNMGYNGSFNYIKEIDETCKSESCLFFAIDIDSVLSSSTNQINIDLLSYVEKNYDVRYISSMYNIYTNIK